MKTTAAAVTNAARTTSDQLRELHRAVMDAGRQAVKAAIQIGGILVKVKEESPHGCFEGWLKFHAPFSRETARRYMQLWRKRDELNGKVELNLSKAFVATGSVKPPKPPRQNATNVAFPPPPTPASELTLDADAQIETDDGEGVMIHTPAEMAEAGKVGFEPLDVGDDGRRMIDASEVVKDPPNLFLAKRYFRACNKQQQASFMDWAGKLQGCAAKATGGVA